jgi:hypothetical protein
MGEHQGRSQPVSFRVLAHPEVAKAIEKLPKAHQRRFADLVKVDHNQGSDGIPVLYLKDRIEYLVRGEVLRWSSFEISEAKIASEDPLGRFS